MKKLVSLVFEEREEINKFVNDNHLKREDIVDIKYHWGLGAYFYVFSFYADESLKGAIRKQVRKNEEEKRKGQLYFLLFLGIAVLVLVVVGVVSLCLS